MANYFLQDKFRKDINKNNILGYKGQIAEDFGLVIKGLWHGSFKNLRPDRFKRVISQCKAEFAGTKQQDAQELLLFLLDGLHEDLNKVKQRRYIEEKVTIFILTKVQVTEVSRLKIAQISARISFRITSYQIPHM